MKRPLEVIFIDTATLILVVAGIAKLYSATGTAEILDHLDPIFLVLNRVVLTLVGMIELAVVGALFIGRNTSTKLLMVAWLSTNFVIYRFGLWFLQIKKPCSCLGTVTDLLPASPATIDHALKASVLYLFLGSVLLLLRRSASQEGSGRHVVKSAELSAQ